MGRPWLLVVAALLPGCGDAEEALGPSAAPWRAAGVLGPVILLPRHRIISPVPRIEIVTPGHDGPIVVLLRTSRGRTHAWRGTARSLAWPADLPALEVGEQGELFVISGRRGASARFERVPAPDPKDWALDPQPVRRLLELGLPAEAIQIDAGLEHAARREAAAMLGWPNRILGAREDPR